MVSFWNDLIWKFITGLYGLILNWTFLSFFLFFYEKIPKKKKKSDKNYLDKQEKS